MFRRTLNRVGSILAASLLIGAAFVAVAQGAPLAPAEIVVTAGESAISLAWTHTDPTAEYGVWRGTDVEVGRARLIGVTRGAGFIDSTAVVGGVYRYAIDVLGDPAGAVLPPEVFTAPVSLSIDAADASPHRVSVFDPLGASCVRCHSISDPVVGTRLLVDLDGSFTSQSGVCLGCHEVVGSDARTGFEGGASGHAVALGMDPADGELLCSQCHDPHGRTDAADALGPKRIRIGGEPVAVATTVNGLCLACHAGSDPSELAAPEWDPNGYPVSGRFPGETVYASESNAHASLTDPTTPTGDIHRPSGSCLHCHGAHRTPAPYDSLLVVGDPAAQSIPNSSAFDVAPLCASCHDWVAPSAETTDTAGWGTHNISTPGGLYAPGTALPCFACHNPHGSARGNDYNITDALGGGLDPLHRQRELCFTCHTSTEGFGWDSGAQAYATPVTDEIFGLSRTALPGDTGATAVPSKLRLPAAHAQDPLKDVHSSVYTGGVVCEDCHGAAHVATGRVDVPEDVTCYECHARTRPMDRADAARTDYYHHVLGHDGGVHTGDVLITDYEPPTATNGYAKYCLTCHTDHLDPDEHPAGPLRTSVTDGTAAPSDFVRGAGGPGICIDCHGQPLSRGAAGATDQKKAFVRVTGGAEQTAIRAIDPTVYQRSAHSYDVATPLGASGSCSKCHNSGVVAPDGMSFQSNAVHTSNNRSLIGLMGDDSTPASWNSTPAEHRLCFSCHAKRGEVRVSTDTGKQLGGMDWFGVESMAPRVYEYRNAAGAVIGSRTFSPEQVFSSMYRDNDVDLSVPKTALSTSGHQAEKIVEDWDERDVNGTPIARFKPSFEDSTTSVRCTGCHDPHRVEDRELQSIGDWPTTRKPVAPLPRAAMRSTGTASSRRGSTRTDTVSSR